MMPTSNLTKKYLLRNKTRNFYVGLNGPIKGVSLIKGPEEVVAETPIEVVIAKQAEAEYPEHIELKEIASDESSLQTESQETVVEVPVDPVEAQEPSQEVLGYAPSTEAVTEDLTEEKEVANSSEDGTTMETPVQVAKRRGRPRRISEQAVNGSGSSLGDGLKSEVGSASDGVSGSTLDNASDNVSGSASSGVSESTE